MVNSILLTNSGINKVSGGGLVSYNLAKALQSCSDLKLILSGQAFPDNKYEDIPAFSMNPISYGYAGHDTNPFFMDYLSFHLLPKNQVDLVMTYGCPFGLTVEECKREFNAKVITDLAPHNIDVSRAEHMKFTGSYPYPHLTDELLWGLYSRHLRFADAVIVHSHSSAKYIKEKARINIDPIVIPHGCDIPDEIKPYPEKFTPGYLGVLGFDKGIQYLVNGWINMFAENPSFKKHELLIAGQGSEGFKIQENYMHYFKVLGYIENLSDFYNSLSIYVQASVIEGFGLPVLETMAHGRPVICAEGAGVSELITDGKDGFVVPIRDIKAISDKIQYFFENPSEISRMGKNARETASRYSWDIIRKKYVEVYQELL